MIERSRSQPRVINPLWIVSLFLGLCEVTVGVVATQSSGWVQGLLAIFSVTFPLLVAAAFFATLWRKPFAFYAPRDFAETVDVRAFVDAMRQSVRSNVEIVESATRLSVESVVPILAGAVADRAVTERAVESAVAVARQAAVESIISIDLSDFGIYVPLEVSVSGSTTVSSLIDTTYFALTEHVPSYTYGVRWVLVNDETGQEYMHMGITWARKHLKQESDTRKLSDVGILAGVALKAVLIS